MTKEMKQILLNLIRDIPDDVVLMRFMSGGDFTVKDAKEDLESENSKLFFNSIFGVAKDLLIRKANKKK